MAFTLSILSAYYGELTLPHGVGDGAFSYSIFILIFITEWRPYLLRLLYLIIC